MIIYFLVKETYNIGTRLTHDFTREEWNKMLKEVGMIDINTKKK